MMNWVCKSPAPVANTAPTSATTAPKRIDLVKNTLSPSCCCVRLCNMPKALMPRMIMPPVITAAKMTCGKARHSCGLATTSMKLRSRTCPVALLISKPVGCCMKLLAARIQMAERVEPSQVSQMKIACTPGLKRSQVNIHTPRKVDSMKKASSASMAKGAPKISPMKRE